MTSRAAFVLLALATSARVLHADPALDHLECYKVKDKQPRATYRADLVGLAAEAQCIVKVPAKLVCVPASKSNVTPPPPGGGPAATPGAVLCYGVKCVKHTLTTIQAHDQFGDRALQPTLSNLLCAPATVSVTTTTTPLPCPTTTTIPVCSGTDTCGGLCPSPQTCTPGAGAGGACGCAGPAVACDGSLDNAYCAFGTCPPGMQCVHTGQGTCGHQCGCQ